MSLQLCLGTLILNESQWLQRLFDQHINWKGLKHWVFVEAADRVYAETNPERVSFQGLSTDGTTELLEELARRHPDKVTHIKFGLTSSNDPAQGKCEARSAYLEVFDLFSPDFFVVLDADEFYCHSQQDRLNRWMEQKLHSGTGFVFRHREIWYPPYSESRNEPLFQHEVVGGFWDIPYCRVWKWFPDLRYESNHNTPTLRSGQMLDYRMKRCETVPYAPYMVHMGFASKLADRAAKNRYYEARGEAADPKRSWYCASRAAFESWNPSSILPRGARVISYRGEIPECFR